MICSGIFDILYSDENSCIMCMNLLLLYAPTVILHSYYANDVYVDDIYRSIYLLSRLQHTIRWKFQQWSNGGGFGEIYPINIFWYRSLYFINSNYQWIFMYILFLFTYIFVLFLATSFERDCSCKIAYFIYMSKSRSSSQSFRKDNFLVAFIKKELFDKFTFGIV